MQGVERCQSKQTKSQQEPQHNLQMSAGRESPPWMGKGCIYPGKHLGQVSPRINGPLPHSWKRLAPCRQLCRLCCGSWWPFVCFGTFQHPALSHSCTQNSLTLLITDYTHHCIFSLVALVNKCILLLLISTLSPFVTGFEPVRDKWGLVQDIWTVGLGDRGSTCLFVYCVWV